MKIYFATSIRGESSEESEKTNKEIISYLKNFGKVLTEHFSEPSIKGEGETNFTDEYIHDRDMDWLDSADIIVAEVSNPSLGVGYEIGRAVEKNKKILCLWKKQNKKLSAMISGCKNLTLSKYTNIEEVKKLINEYFSTS